jgi:hypothetical protein
MRFGERLVVAIFGPIYRTFFDRLFWWFLAKVKVFLLADLNAQVSRIERRFDAAESNAQQRWAAIEERLRSAEMSNAAQWDALEQLLLALYRQPILQVSDPDSRRETPEESSLLREKGLARVHAANDIR